LQLVYERTNETTSLETAIFSISQKWTVLCCMSEMLTNTITLNYNSKSHKFAVEVFEKLIGAIASFFNQA